MFVLCVFLPLLNLTLAVLGHVELCEPELGEPLHAKFSLQIDLAEECRAMPAVQA